MDGKKPALPFFFRDWYNQCLRSLQEEDWREQFRSEDLRWCVTSSVFHSNGFLDEQHKVIGNENDPQSEIK